MSQNAKLTVIFDGDDTLWKTQQFYEAAKEAWVKLLEKYKLGSTKDAVLLDAFDASRVAISGLTFDRFQESMLLYTAQLVGAKNKKWTVDLENKVRKIASIAKTPPVLFEDTLPVLETLMKKVNLILFTSGDNTTQWNKIFSLNIRKYFDYVHVTDKKDTASFEFLMHEHKLNPPSTWMIGNSPKSDILPALEVGFNAILVENDTWYYDKTMLPYNESRFFQVKTLKQAMKIVLREIEGCYEGVYSRNS